MSDDGGVATRAPNGRRVGEEIGANASLPASVEAARTRSNGQGSDAADSERDTREASTVLRALELMELMAERGPLTAKILAERVHIKLGSCYYILRTLESAGYVRHDSSRRYGLGYKVALLHDSLEAELAESPELMEILYKLNLASAESCYLSALVGGEVRVQHHLNGRSAVQVRGLGLGYGGRLHARASGKALMAYRHEAEIRSYFRLHPLEPCTDHTITDIEVLLKELKKVARVGIAYEREEFAEGVSCIAAPFFDSRDRPAGSFAVALPSQRFGNSARDIALAVHSAGAEASRVLGCTSTYPLASPLLSRTPRRPTRRED
jgi:IclR family transcriptional regulator, acetate operon repressor